MKRVQTQTPNRDRKGADRRSLSPILSLTAASLAAAALLVAPAPAQQPVTKATATKAPAAKAATTTKTFTPPKTPWGDPDLQGVWPGTDMVGTPLERPANLGERASYTEDEYNKKVQHAKEQEKIDNAEFVSKNPLIARGDGFVTCEQDSERCRDGVRIGPPNYWDERGKPSLQTSLIQDPPNGRIPALTPEAAKMAAERAATRRARPCTTTSAGCHDTWEDESLWDRCITRGAVGSVVPNTYNQGNQIVQAPGIVIFRNEMIHEARIIPVDGRPHVNSKIRTWMGDSRGHWEGNTLVVETTNFLPGVPVGNTPTSADLKLTERFNLENESTLKYSVTVEDPNTWTRPWTISFPLKHEAQYTLFEYACHEGNYYMYNALAGARAEEKKAGK